MRSVVHALATGSQCQECPRSILSGIRPVCTVAPHPLPPCLLEVLILEGLQANVLEVLILVDLLSRLLIPIDFKSFIISDLIKNGEFTEVLILGGLGRAVGRDCRT